ncbi:MAG: protein-glutamate O-methyltransferase CheR [Thermoproteota archaeon]
MSAMEKIPDPDLELILRRIADGDGTQKYRTSFLVRRIEHRMRAKKIQSYREYDRLLSSDPKEYVELTSLFSVTVTEFFRDIELFELLKSNILPSLSNEIKIWCAGCATGEEPYSVAIVASELQRISGQRISILATDINPDSIMVATAGIYEEKSLKNMPAELKAKYFRKVGENSWQVDSKIRDSVVYNVNDLDKSAPPASDLDVILCRNVMIYFDSGSRERLLQKFYDALKPKGYFVMGQSEIMMGRAFSLFKTVYPKERVYQRA